MRSFVVALLVAGGCAFSPAPHVAAPQVRAGCSRPIVMMAGWNDEYGGDSLKSSSKQELKTSSSSFDQQMKAQDAKNNNVLLGMSVGTLAIIAALFIPALTKGG